MNVPILPIIQTKGKARAQKEENETKILTPADISRAFYQGR